MEAATASARPRLALTMGDPAGIGPELCAIVAGMPLALSAADLVIVGSAETLSRAAQSLDLPSDWARAVEIVDIGPPAEPITPGRISAASGALSRTCLDRAIDMALAHEVEGIVTAPISKEAWHLAGVDFPGHTEYLAHRCGTSEFGMMLVWNSMRILHLTTHCSLRSAIEQVTKDRILHMLDLFRRALVEVGVRSPAIAVAGLNPHSGEAGLFGDEEEREIIPAVEEARRRGFSVEGPVVPDTVFARARKGEFDGVLAMYHDQGHVAVKTLAFEPHAGGRWSAVHGVNVTIGLPIVRTSVDHGVALDIAGQGQARPESLVDAILLAAQIAGARKGNLAGGGDARE